ncbi:hypothetical protein PNK_0874 [Candidatus Protochlamydia naegleriophila]|uniref:Mce/MlaD domain-containing protein n=1 Tax=Candidatus Protochlamydia naegleriophila TaxID=389348 RepID=A0A0U5EQR1_9BACT|nr:MlaD family protein [Candidatus Protochlamydia naegleriophila]CUI16499.1 hypothetical protein PNK_0874 [Candidatus Protochlamydia naegleriophila]
MAASVKNILIGIFVLLALAIIVFMILFLHPSVGDNAKTLRVRFTNIDKVNVGTRVTYAGRPVGEVVSISELPDARTDRIAHNGDIYVYELILKVDSSVNVYNTDEISIRTSGLLGEKNVEIDPQPLHPGERLFSVEDQILYATPAGSVEDTLKQMGQLSAKFQVVLDDFHDVMMEIKKEKIVENLAQTMKNAVNITDSLNQPDKLNRTLNNLVDLSERAHRSWDVIDETLHNVRHLSYRAENSWASVDNTLQEFNNASKELSLASSRLHQITEQTDQLVANIAQGQGTIGRLFVGDDLYLRFKSILNKGETIFSDVKQYGILFQNDKRWQRIQARRMRLLEKLSDPAQFANYFNREVDEISTSLSSVSMVLNEAECYPYSLLNTPEFSCRFADLLRRVTEMEDSLKMYNEQVVAQE